MVLEKVFLANTVYLPEKRQIVLEFSGSQKRLSKRYAFFPSFYIPNSEEFLGFAKNFDSKKIKVDVVNEKSVRVVAATFSDLLLAAKVVSDFFGKTVLLLDPRRQFLVENGWSYFDSFAVLGNELTKDDSICAPDVSPDFLFSSVKSAFFELKKADEAAAGEFLEKFCLSNILKTNVLELPQAKLELSELFLENLFFGHKFPLLFSGEKKCGSIDFVEKNFGKTGFAKLNFLSVFNSIASFPFFNIGFDSVNCQCCRDSIAAKKVSPSSLVETDFLFDGVYFESKFSSFAKQFHEEHGSKQQRIDFQKEWCLKTVPVGPFFSGEKAVLPLIDYSFLAKKKFVSDFFVFKGKTWFCEKNESFISKELKAMQKSLSSAAKLVSTKSSQRIASSGILFTEQLSGDFSFSYYSSFFSKLREIYLGVFLRFADHGSRFFDQKISDSIECIQKSLLSDFLDFAEQNGSESIKIGGFEALVKSKNPFFLAKKFSKEFNLPNPEISF